MATKVYVGNLTRDVRENDLREAFEKFGDVDRVFLREGFAFVHMKDPRDAEDAIRQLDGRSFAGCDKVRVEKPHDDRPDGGGKGSGCYNCGQPGHFARECKEPRRDGGSGPRTGCYSCGEPGHFARECPKGSGGGGAPVRGRSPPPPSYGAYRDRSPRGPPPGAPRERSPYGYRSGRSPPGGYGSYRRERSPYGRPRSPYGRPPSPYGRPPSPYGGYRDNYRSDPYRDSASYRDAGYPSGFRDSGAAREPVGYRDPRDAAPYRERSPYGGGGAGGFRDSYRDRSPHYPPPPRY